MLNNAVEQTLGRKSEIDESVFSDVLLKRLKNADFDAMSNDVERFLEDRNEAKLINMRVIKNLLT